MAPRRGGWSLCRGRVPFCRARARRFPRGGGDVAQSFNSMSEALARAEGLRKRMTADIAHDLRTPLSLILGHAEALDEGILPTTPEAIHVIHDEALRLARLVDDLRT